jgi:hypothetical protein
MPQKKWDSTEKEAFNEEKGMLSSNTNKQGEFIKALGKGKG